MAIDIENWPHTRYKNGSYLVGVYLGADPSGLTSGSYSYSVTVLKDEYEEVFEKSFDSLHQAIAYINKSYADWSLLDLNSPKGEGCGSCSAH